MQNEFEILTYERLRHFKLFLNKITYRNFHTHGAFEFLLVLEGDGSIQFRDKSCALHPGSLVLVNPHESHEIDARDGYVLTLILQVSRHFCQDYFPLLRSVRFSTHEVSDIFHSELLSICQTQILEIARAYLQEDDNYPLVCVSLTARLFHLLLGTLSYKVLTEQDHTRMKKKISRLERISSYLEENYLLPIRLKDIAQREGLTDTYISHLFSEQYGTSFQTYLNNLRFEKAMTYLSDPSISLSDAAMGSGFSDPKYLSQMFEKRMGYPLKEYRKGIRNAKAAASVTPQKIMLEQIFSPEESMVYLKTHNILESPFKGMTKPAPIR